MPIETAEATAFNPASGDPLPPTASHAARSLSLFISGKPMLSDRTLAIYTRVIREGVDHQSYTLADWNAALGLEAENPLGDVVLRTLESRVSDNDAVLDSSKVLETQLKEKFGAEGRGLHEYTSNVESALPENLVKTLRWIATRRNGIVHGDGDGFQDTQERARFVLQAARGWDWLANFESPVNEEQRLAASSLRRCNMWEKMNEPISPKAVAVGGGTLTLGAMLLAWAFAGPGAMADVAVIAGLLTVLASHSAYEQAIIIKKNNDRNKVRKITP